MAEFADRFQNYASAGLRWGLCIEDHPDVRREYSIAFGRDLGEPFASRYADKEYVRCRITIPGHGDVHEGYKEIPKTVRRKDGNGYRNVPWEDTFDNLSTLQTQACGHALRSAGYPHSLPDLKMVILWRRRDAEVESLVAALDAAGGDEDIEEDDEQQAPPVEQRTTHPGPAPKPSDVAPTAPPQQAQPTGGENVYGSESLLIAMADDAVRSMYDQMTEPVRNKLQTWAEANQPRITVLRAYMKHLLDREHGQATSTTRNGKPSGWVETAAAATTRQMEGTMKVGDQDVPVDTGYGGVKVTDVPAEEMDTERAALLEGVAEVRGRLTALAAERPNEYAKAVKAMEEAGIKLNHPITMEQLITLDEIVSEYEAPV